MDYINEIAEALSGSHAAVMIGAGFSKNADNISSTDKWFKNWNELSDEFYETLYGKDESGKKYNSSLRLAQEVEVIAGRPKLEKILKNAVPDADYGPSILYRKLMELPWKDIFTTNYDTLLERTADTISKRRYNIVVNQEDLVNSNDAARIIKLHGSFPSHRPFIITEEDYRTYPVKFAAMVNTVQQSLLENVFCMIGFSCEDPNFLSWIGWIHDNLGKSSSQKIYMIAVLSVPEVKQKMLFDKNIIVVDLEKMYPEKNIRQRLESFFDSLRKLIEEKENRDRWFDISKDMIESNDSYENKIKKLKKLNDTYPGWVFLPWSVKFKVNSVLASLEINYFNNEEKLEDLSKDLQIDYIYEYVYFLNIIGHPILSKDTNKIWILLNDTENRANKKMQYIYLQLLRSFRELAEWDKYDECRKKIIIALLDYENKQFLYACDWWMNLYRFKDVNLLDLLDSWNLTTGDLYWPIVKAGMYSLIGGTAKGEQVLTAVLPQIRRQLMKNHRNAYLCSVEESAVTLLNFIRKSNLHKIKECETSIHSQQISWWNTNDEYYSQLNKEDKKDFKSKNFNFDLTVKYTSMQGNYNTKVYYALEYLRFLEQTGHPFRINYTVINFEFNSIIKPLYLSYPHLCFIQMLIAQDKKKLDFLYGQNKLSGMSQAEIDSGLQQYLDILNVVKKNIEHKNMELVETIFGHATLILPEVISRLCYKCSTTMLDKVLNQMLILCNSDIRDQFEGIDKIIKGVCNAYTEEEQMERLSTILKFPILRKEMYNYIDPVNYLKNPKKKRVLDEELYYSVILQIRKLVETGSEIEQEDAIDRLFILNSCICLKKKDKEFLYCKLEEVDESFELTRLYYLDKKRYKEVPRLVLNKTLETMKHNSIKGVFFSGGNHYGNLIAVLSGITLDKNDIVNFFSKMINMLDASIEWDKNNESFDVKKRIRQSYDVSLGLIMLKIKDNNEFTYEEKKIITDYYNKLSLYYSNSCLLKYLSLILLNNFYDDQRDDRFNNIYKLIEEELWSCSDEDLIILFEFYSMSKKMNFNFKRVKKFKYFTNMVYQMIIYKIININVVDKRLPLNLLEVLLINGIEEKKSSIQLFKNLSRIEKSTQIEWNESEDKALNKLASRIEICNIAKEYYKLGYRHENILKWKELTNDTNEFIEIRNIEFDN